MPQCLPGNLGECPRKFDPGRSATDEHERQQFLSSCVVRLALGPLEREQDPATNVKRIFQRF